MAQTLRLKAFLFEERERYGEIISSAEEVYKECFVQRALVEERNISEDSRRWTTRDKEKIENFSQAYDIILHGQGEVNIAYLQVLHTLVMKNLLPNAGHFRTKPARPAKDASVWYSSPGLIALQLKTLCQQVAQEKEERVTAAARFLVFFLSIHPFSNGNGRVARLAIARLLMEDTVYPIRLKRIGSEAYASMLNTARITGHLEELKKYIQESMEESIRFACFLLDIQ